MSKSSSTPPPEVNPPVIKSTTEPNPSKKITKKPASSGRYTIDLSKTLKQLGVELESRDSQKASDKNASPQISGKTVKEKDLSINDVTGKGNAVSGEPVFSEDGKKYRGFASITAPWELSGMLASVGYECLPYLAVQISLFVVTPSEAKVRALMLEGPSGCGKSFLAKSLAKITDAELMVLSCYQGMPTQNLIEAPSSFALASAMARVGGARVGGETASELMNLGLITRAFLLSNERPVILLVDELDKPDSAIDTFFLGPLQDATVYLESRPPVRANPENIIVIFTKNFNRKIDEALLRRCHPIKMTYLDSTLETKILSKHCEPRLVANLVSVADRMRYSGGTYGFERPPAPEELLLAGHYVMKLLLWGIHDFAVVAQSIWSIVAKSEHDRAVLEHMMRFHPDFMDPLIPDPKNATFEDVLRRFGRVVLEGIVADPDEERRKKAWEADGF